MSLSKYRLVPISPDWRPERKDATVIFSRKVRQRRVLGTKNHQHTEGGACNQSAFINMPSTFSDLVEGSHIHGLYIILKGCDLLLQLVYTDLVVLHHTLDLQLLNAVAHRHQFG